MRAVPDDIRRAIATERAGADHVRPLRSMILNERDARVRRCDQCGGWRYRKYRGGDAPHRCARVLGLDTEARPA